MLYINLWQMNDQQSSLKMGEHEKKEKCRRDEMNVSEHGMNGG